MGVGSKLLCILWPLCVYLGPGPENFFRIYGPPNPWRVLGTNSKYPRYFCVPFAGNITGRQYSQDWLTALPGVNSGTCGAEARPTGPTTPANGSPPPPAMNSGYAPGY